MARYVHSSYAIERRAAFIATFLSNDPTDFSFTNLRSPITSSRGTATTLKLSQERLAWGEKNPSRTPENPRSSSAAMVPYDSTELESVAELFTEAEHPSVLLCVIRAANKPGFRFEVLAFRLQSEHDVHLFLNLFTTLTQQQQPQTADVFPVQSRSTPFNRDDPSYSPPQSVRIRPKSSTTQQLQSVAWSSANLPSTMSTQSQMDGWGTFRAIEGTSRRNQPINSTGSLRISGDRHADNRVNEVMSRSVNFSEARPAGHSSGVRLQGRTETELRRPMETSTDRTFTTRHVGVMADLDSSIPRSRPGDYIPLEGKLSSKHERMYIYADGTKMAEVSCQTNLRPPSIKVSRRGNGSSSFIESNGQINNIGRSGIMSGTPGLPRHSMSHRFTDGVDERDSAAGRDQRNPRSMQRRMTLVDNGVVKVTVEEYQDPAERKSEEFPPASQSSDQTIDEPDTTFDRKEIKHINRIQPVSGELDRSRRSDLTNGPRSRRLDSYESSPSLKIGRSPAAMTSTEQSVSRRRSVPRSTSDTQHINHPLAAEETRQMGRRRSSYRDDTVDRSPYTMTTNRDDGAVVHQSRPVILRHEPATTYSTHPRHNAYTLRHDPAVCHQSEPIIVRREPMTSEKKRHHQVQGSQRSHETVYQSQPTTSVRVKPTTHPVRHHSSVYESQPITIRAEPTTYPVRQHRSTTHESVYDTRPITIRTEPSSYSIRQNRPNTNESVYQSRPVKLRQKSVNSDYGHERNDVYREPRNLEYRSAAGGTTGPVMMMRQSRSRLQMP